MAVRWEDGISKENLKILVDYAGRAYNWRRSGLLLENGRYGQMYSKIDLQELALQGQSPLPISIQSAICETADAMTVSSRPSLYVAHRAYPGDEGRTQTAMKIAQKYRFMLQKAWTESYGNMQFDRIQSDSTNVGHGIGAVFPSYNNGEFNVNYKRIPWRFYFPDPDATNQFYEDSENQLYAFPISKNIAYRTAKGHDPSLTQKQFDEEFAKGEAATMQTQFMEDQKWLSRTRKSSSSHLLYCQRLTLEEKTVYYIVPTKSSEEFAGMKFRTYFEIPSEISKMQKDGLIRIKPSTDFYLTEYISIGNKGFKNVLSLRQYNTVPLTHDFRDNIFPLGRMFYLFPIGRAINKFIMSGIINASLLNATRIIAPFGSIVNKSEWKLNSSVPGAILEYKYVDSQGKPEVIKSTPMDEGWLVMPRYLTYVAEYVSGIFGVNMGDTKDAPDVFSTVASLQASGSQRIKRRLGNVDSFLSQLGRVGAEIIQSYAPPNGYASSFDIPNQKVQVETYNQIESYEDNGKPKLRFKEDSDLSAGTGDIIFTSQGSVGYETATQALALTTLATQLGVKELVPEILKLYNVGDSEKITKRMDENARLRESNAQLQGVVKELDGRRKVMENNIFQLAKQVKAEKFAGKLSVELEKFMNNPMDYIQKMVE